MSHHTYDSFGFFMHAAPPEISIPIPFFIREAENGGVPESVEPLFVRIGGEYFHNLLENTWDQYVNTLTKA